MNRAAGRRAAAPKSRGFRPDATLVLTILLPLLAAGLTLGLRQQHHPRLVLPPTRTALTHAAVVCPASSRASRVTVVAAADGSVAALAAGKGKPAAPVTVEADRPASVSGLGGDAGILTGSGPTAPGLVAGRSTVKPLTATDCPVTSSDEWFTGVGAGATHDSVLEVVNPEEGPAVVDVDVLGSTGAVPASALAGIEVAGDSSESFDLGKLIPSNSTLALHARVERGQVAMSVTDEQLSLTGGKPVAEWMPGQSAPARKVTLLGLPSGGDSRQLVIANPGQDELSGTVKLVTSDAVLTPSGAPTFDVGPESVATVRLDGMLRRKIAKGALGVEVDGNHAMTATLRTTVGGDLAISAPGDEVGGETSVVVPQGPKQVVFGDATVVGGVTVTAIDARGRTLTTRRVALTPRQGESVSVPAKAVLLRIVPRGGDVRGAVVVTGHGAAVVPIRPLQRSGLVPGVRPALR